MARTAGGPDHAGRCACALRRAATYLNHRELHAYCDAVEAGNLPISHFARLDAHQRATRDVTFDLLYSRMTRVRSRAKKYGAETMTAHRTLLARWESLGLGTLNPVLGTFSLTRVGKLLHQPMIPRHYLAKDRSALASVMSLRKEAGPAYRGY